MIVVIDTNVWISAFHFSREDGTVYRAVERAIALDTIAISTEIEREIARVLEESFAWPTNRIFAVLSNALGNAVRITLYGTVKGCRDPKDDMILECAERAQADLIVTGDRDLLALKAHNRTKILTPAEYLKMP